jgi:hypothetical protein
MRSWTFENVCLLGSVDERGQSIHVDLDMRPNHFIKKLQPHLHSDNTLATH